ncbi:MAG TPA: DUF599 domain-containing protein [Nitrosospira sp.]|jgi:uncharacterized membrane protein|nr:DUF599 domain-containing protein [Nitrosospira sp.]
MLFNVGDWIALGWFLLMWVGYDQFAERWSVKHPSLLREMNNYRREWMLRVTHRDNRIADVALMANLSSSPTFFASTTIIIIGGLLAMLGRTSQAVDVVSKIPFLVNVSEAVWEIKIGLLVCVFVFAFFRFTWALRQFNFCAILIGAAPDSTGFHANGEAMRASYSDRVGKLIALAGESFNDGLRAYYFAIAALSWFVQPVAFMLATTIVVLILYHREFKSNVLHTLTGDTK